MSTTFKIVKTKDFSVEGVPQRHYSCAHKGRVYGVSTLRFETADFTVKDNILTLNIDVEVIVEPGVNHLGEPCKYLTLVPKCIFAIAPY